MYLEWIGINKSKFLFSIAAETTYMWYGKVFYDALYYEHGPLKLLQANYKCSWIILCSVKKIWSAALGADM